MGILFIHDLREFAISDKTNSKSLRDWEIVEKYLDCKGRNISKEDELKIGMAWKYYYARGWSPSITLIKTFEEHSLRYKSEGYILSENVVPPKELLSVFDRMLATDKEILEKNRFDYSRLGKTAKNSQVNYKTNLTNSEKLIKNSIQNVINNLGKKERLFYTFSIIWIFWTVFRSNDDYELFGIYLEQWRGNTLVNIISPILGILLFKKIYQWINNGKTGN